MAKVVNTRNFYMLFIISPSGSQVYSKILNNTVDFDSNQLMQLAPMLFTIQNITRLAKPDGVGKEEIEEGFEEMINHRLHFVSTKDFKIHFYTSLTHLGFVLVTSTKLSEVGGIFKRIYLSYSDFVSKDASYSDNQPIKSLVFDHAISNIFLQNSG